MFKIEFFVEDRFLGEAFKRLAGIARNLQHAYVPNVEAEPKAKAANGHAPKVRVTAADSAALFMKELAKRRLVEFDAAKAREIAVGMGFSPTSYSYILKALGSQGLIKKAAHRRR